MQVEPESEVEHEQHCQHRAGMRQGRPAERHHEYRDDEPVRPEYRVTESDARVDDEEPELAAGPGDTLPPPAAHRSRDRRVDLKQNMTHPISRSVGQHRSVAGTRGRARRSRCGIPPVPAADAGDRAILIEQ